MPDERARSARSARADADPEPPWPGAIWNDGEWYVKASALSASVRKMVLKDNDAFLVTDRRADFPATMPGEFGYYRCGTRYLSTLEVRLQGDLPVVLDARLVGDENSLVSELTNADMLVGDGRRLPPSSLLLRRHVVLEQDVLFERLVLHNFTVDPVDLVLTVAFEADFADMFEVRGSKRPARGKKLPARVEEQGLVLGYEGLDGILRTTRIDVEPRAPAWHGQTLVIDLHLEPAQDREVRLRVSPAERARAPVVHAQPDSSSTQVWNVPSPQRRAVREDLGLLPRLRTNHHGLERILERALSDLVVMVSRTPEGLYPYAGIPWYCAPFGRDGSITALQTLHWMPALARGVLRFQAAHQARDFDDFTDREPGKILHELRWGEMANLREIPFVPYYGSVDATPLFVILLAEYVRTTGDLASLRELWPNALAALHWIEHHGDVDGDGFVEYVSRSTSGLRNQGWKDSFDGIAHADGRLAEPPIALCEVQGYVIRAFRGAAWLARLLGDEHRSSVLLARADKLQRRLHEAFWIEELGAFALALDRDKQPCRVLTTNAGHVLWARAADEEPGRRLARRLTGAEMSSGYGLRTLEAGARRYSPLSYHNGSIWPHDNAMVAEGLRAYANVEGALEVFTGVVAALGNSPDDRVPELYCGFQRQGDAGPVPYPVACSPQAWASGAMLQFVSTLLGLAVEGLGSQVCFEDPALPPWIDWLEVTGLPTPKGPIDFSVVRGRNACSVEVRSKPAPLNVVVRA